MVQTRGVNLWEWLRQNKVIALPLAVFAGMSLMMATFVGTQLYIQRTKHQHQLQERQDKLFLTLVQQLSSTEGERETAILAMARLDDPGAVTTLVDLLSQETNPSLMSTIHRALINKGTTALEPLTILNKSLSNDYLALQQSGDLSEKPKIARRLRFTKEACREADPCGIAKILTFYSGKLHSANLEGADLGTDGNEIAQFALVLEGVDLSGINLPKAILDRANLKNSIFSSAGKDGRVGTLDDEIANLRGANLTNAHLTGALMSYVSLEGSNLMGASLDRANLANAQLNNSNLSSARLIGAQLQQAMLAGASLTGANLGVVQLSQSNLVGANLGQVKAVSADLKDPTLPDLLGMEQT